MELYIFQERFDSTFKRVKIKVERFKQEYIEFKMGRNLYRMVLQDASKHTFDDLLTSDIVHVYVKGEDYSKAYLMDYVRDFPIHELGLTPPQQILISDIERSEKARLQKVQDITSMLIDHFSNQNTEKFKVLSEVASFGFSDPVFLQELRGYFNSFES